MPAGLVSAAPPATTPDTSVVPLASSRTEGAEFADALDAAFDLSEEAAQRAADDDTDTPPIELAPLQSVTPVMLPSAGAVALALNAGEGGHDQASESVGEVKDIHTGLSSFEATASPVADDGESPHDPSDGSVAASVQRTWPDVSERASLFSRHSEAAPSPGADEPGAAAPAGDSLDAPGASARNDTAAVLETTSVAGSEAAAEATETESAGGGKSDAVRRQSAREGVEPFEEGSRMNTAAPLTSSTNGESHDGSRQQKERLAGLHLEMAIRAGARPSGYFAVGAPLIVQNSERALELMRPAVEAAATSATSHTADNVERMVQTMRVMLKDDVSVATVRLRPEHLGEVSIQVRMDGRSVTATVNAQSAAVREWLQLHEDALRSSLSQHGLTLDRLVVQREARQERREQPREELPSGRSRKPTDPQARFEVTA